MNPMVTLTHRQAAGKAPDWLLAVRWPNTTKYYRFETESLAQTAYDLILAMPTTEPEGWSND